MSLTRKWSLLSAVLVVAIFVAGWFLLIAPKRSEAAGLRDQASSQEEANARLVQKLQVLKAQQAELPKQRALLATYRIQIPDNPALPSLIRDLTAAGRKVGATIDELTPQPPVAAVSSSTSLAPTTSTSTSATGSSTTGDTSSTTTTATGSSTTADTSSTTTASNDPAASAPAAPATTLFQVPLAVKVSGSYFELEQFVNKLEGLKRSFLVKGFELKPADNTTDVAPGTLTLAIQGQVFLAPEATVPAKAAPATSSSATAGE